MWSVAEVATPIVDSATLKQFVQDLLTIGREKPISLSQLLATLANRQKIPYFASVLRKMSVEILQVPLSDVMAKHPDIFPGNFVATVRLGEDTGHLSKYLELLK